MRHHTIAVLTAGTVLSAATLFAQPAAAVPVSNLAPAADELSTTQNVAWVCGPLRCWWTPRYYYAPVCLRRAPIRLTATRPTVIRLMASGYGYPWPTAIVWSGRAGATASASARLLGRRRW